MKSPIIWVAGACFAVLIAFALFGQNDATVVNRNISKAADNFEVRRRVIFLNGITDNYLLSIDGFCNIKSDRKDAQLEVICKTEKGYKKHFLGLSDNVSYFVEQIGDSDVNAYHYRVTFKPQSFLLDVDFRGDVEAAADAVKPDSSD